MCSVPSVCSRICRTARGAVALAQRLDQARVLLVGAGQDLGRVGDQRDQVAHLRLHVGHRAQQPRRLRRPRRCRCGSGCRCGRYSSKFSSSPAIFATSSSSRSNCASLPRSAASITAPGLDRDPVVEHRPGALVQRLAGLLGQRRLLGDEGAAGPPPLRDQVPALHQRRQRLPQSRARDPQPPRQLPLRRQLAPRRQQPEPDRAPQAAPPSPRTCSPGAPA